MMKQKKQTQPAKLSDEAIDFIRNYALKESKITLPIDEDDLDSIFDFAVECELDMLDENDEDKAYDYPEKERNERGDKFVSEMSSVDFYVDIEDVNLRLK